MARITWQNIQAPQLSTRDLMISGNQMADAFSRFGETLEKRDALKTSRVNNDLQASVALANAPEQFAALRQQDLTQLDPRVDKAAFANAIAAREAQYTQQAKNQEDLLNSQVMAKFGNQGYELGKAILAGDQEAERMVMERSSVDPEFGRYMSQVSKELMEYRDQGVDNRHAKDILNEDNRAALAREAGDAAQRAIYNRSVIAGESRDAAAEAERLEGIAAYQDAQQAIRSLPPTGSTKDAIQLLRANGQFEGKSENYTNKFLSVMADPANGRDAVNTPTEAQLDGSGIDPGAGASVGVMTEEATDAAVSPRAIIAGLNRNIEEAGVAEARALNQLVARNPRIAIVRAIDQFKDVTSEDVAAAAKLAGISPDDLAGIQGNNTNAQVMAVLKHGKNVRDADPFSARGRRNEGATYTDANGMEREYGPYSTHSEWLWGGERALKEQLKLLNADLQDIGQQKAYDKEESEIKGQIESLRVEAARIQAEISSNRSRDLPVVEQLRAQKRLEDKVKALTKDTSPSKDYSGR